MPHTEGRYQHDLEFNDARVFIAPGDLNVSGAGATLTRNAGGNWSFSIAVASTIFISVNLSTILLRRTGFSEDTQNLFGPANPNSPAATAIPGSAQPQVYRPDQIPSMNTAQQIQPRRQLKVKGYRLLSFDSIYSLAVVAATTLQSRVDLTQFVNNVAPAVTAIVPVANNGLTNVVQANPYVSNLALTTAQLQAISNPPGGYPGYVNLVDQSLWLEWDIVTAATGTAQFYGFDVVIGY